MSTFNLTIFHWYVSSKAQVGVEQGKQFHWKCRERELWRAGFDRNAIPNIIMREWRMTPPPVRTYWTTISNLGGSEEELSSLRSKSNHIAFAMDTRVVKMYIARLKLRLKFNEQTKQILAEMDQFIKELRA